MKEEQRCCTGSQLSRTCPESVLRCAHLAFTSLPQYFLLLFLPLMRILKLKILITFVVTKVAL